MLPGAAASEGQGVADSTAGPLWGLEDPFNWKQGLLADDQKVT